MDDAPETRRRIGIIIAQPYREGRKAARFACFSPPDSLVTFPSYEDENFEHLRRLHEKGIQAVEEVVEGVCQTEVRVPWSRWVETTPPDAPSPDARAPDISPDVLKRLEDAVRETATVDVLSDDWGNLGRMDRSATVLKPFIIPGKGVGPPSKELKVPQPKEEPPPPPKEIAPEPIKEPVEEEEEEEEEEQSSPDILKLQMLQRKMMRRIHERRAAAAAAESPLQRFLRHYETRLNDLYPEEGRAFSESLRLHRVT